MSEQDPLRNTKEIGQLINRMLFHRPKNDMEMDLYAHDLAYWLEKVQDQIQAPIAVPSVEHPMLTMAKEGHTPFAAAAQCNPTGPTKV